MNTTDEILSQIDDAIEDWSVGPDAMRSGAPAGAGLTSSAPRMPRLGNVVVTVAVDTSGFQRAMREFAEGMAKIAAAFEAMIANNAGMRRMLGLPLRDAHHPPKLSIDGAAYHRRRNARRRRR